MANYNDSFKASLEAKGYTSSFTDAWNQYLQDNTDIESTVTPDMLAAWLSGKGFTGSVPDMLQQYAESTGYTSHAEQVIADAFLGCYQDVYDFDGVDDRGQLQFRAIDPDGDNTFEFWSPPSLATFQVMVAQNISATVASREFQVYSGGSNQLVVVFGGVTNILFSTAQGFKPSTKYGLTLIGNTASIFEGGLGGTLVRTTAFTRGTAREPSAVTLICCRGNGAGLFGGYFQGPQYDLKINGTLWPISERTQTIQLPSPSGLGAELITQSVLENPFSKGSQWTYLGGGRWQLIGDGNVNTLEFFAASGASQPTSGFFEFEIESISGTLTCVVSASGTDSPATFNTVGPKRYYYTKQGNTGNPTNGNLIQLKRLSGVVSCIIKNISFKPLGTCNPLTLVNTTAERWSKQEVPCPSPDPLTPFFTQQPEPQSVAVGATPTFTSDALVGQGAVTYQWQLNTGGGFSDIVGATLKTLTLLPVVLGQNGNQLRVVATANARPVFSISVTLTVTL